MIRIPSSALRLTAGILPLLAAAPAVGQDDDDAVFDRTPRDCLIVSQIDETEVVDDQTIIFHTRNRRAYRNTLPRACPGLLRENRILYETRSSQLCSIDMITVLEGFGVGIRPGFTCRLGEFVPLSEADLEDLEYRKKNGGAPQTIETSEVDVDAEDEPEQAPAETPADTPDSPQ